MTRCVRPVPAGRTAEPRTCWSACFGSRPVRMCSSTDSSNLAYAVSLTSFRPSSGAYSLSGSTFSAAARYFFPCFAIFLRAAGADNSPFVPGRQCSVSNGNAHAAGRALDHAHGGLDIVGVQILHFGFGDLADLGARNRSGRPAARCTAALIDVGGLFDQIGRGRRLCDEVEGTILEDRDQRRDDHAGLTGRPLVVLLQERHPVDAVLAERRPDRRRRRGLASRQLKRDDRFYFLSHSSDDPLDLQEVELDWRFATEERHQHAHLALLGVDVVDDADEVGEWTVDNL